MKQEKEEKLVHVRIFQITSDSEVRNSSHIRLKTQMSKRKHGLCKRSTAV